MAATGWADPPAALNSEAIGRTSKLDALKHRSENPFRRDYQALIDVNSRRQNSRHPSGSWAQARLVKSQCTCSSGFSRVMSVTVGPCFKCDRSLVALAAVSNHGYPSKKAHLFHADIQRVRAQRLRLAIRSRCRHGGFDCVMQKRAGIESLTDHTNGPERHLTHAGRKWAEQHRRRCASID